MVRVVAQRVRTASVSVGGIEVGAIGCGLVLLIGIQDTDDDPVINRVADKVAVMRIFEDPDGKMNLSTSDIGGSMLVISQFTLYGDVRKGRRPSFIRAANPEQGNALYQRFANRLRFHGYPVSTGTFGAHMLVALENDGPVTIILDSAEE